MRVRRSVSTFTRLSPTADGAELGVVRSMTTVLAAATLFFLALTISSFFDQAEYAYPYWQLVAGIAVFGTPMVMVAVAPWSSLHQLRILHGAYAVIFTVAVLSWVPAFINGPMPAEMAPWTVGLTALGTVPAAIAWRPAAAWAFLLGNSFAITPIRILADGGADVSLAIQYAFFTITVCAAFTAVATVAMTAGREVDVATAAARTSTMRAAALTARGEEQAHLDALVHDEVIATIFAAAGAGRSDSTSTRDQAARTIARLSELKHATASVPELIHVDYLIQGLTSSISEITDAAALVVEGTRRAPLPSSIASALIEATVEALRNSVVHAAAAVEPVSRGVLLRLDSDRVEITVTDDGQGFEPHRVPANRLGIVVSILGRVKALPGAYATVQSEPGEGTCVTVGWIE
ncbi:ATP-binding protein [Salinibacterium sp. NSLL150]|nr:ATP-binding protein [Salinibacterium sp. NSLL35]MBH0100957.1 ATP-binding protein [Salinibacterium sp. NSLL150]MBH0103716.1 ATP-binding protein [Salinibacterium sp. NSLL16]MBH0106477.1 ATP-binding protein [Salinibacterium sp. NSLL17]